MSKSIYVAGPMRYRENYNFPAFDAAAAQLRADGWTVFNPAEHDRELGFDETRDEYRADGWNDPTIIPDVFSFRVAFKWDVESIMDSDAIYLLEGWENSSGARIELSIAEFIGSTVMYAPDARRRENALDAV